MKNAETLLAEMPKIDSHRWDSDLGDLVAEKVTPRGFIRDEVLHVSAENGDGAADYYGGEHGDPVIHATLLEFAKKNGGFWEWVNPGCVALYAV